jgi:hypothetical protein
MGKFRNRPQPMPDPNADPSAFAINDPKMRAAMGLPPLTLGPLVPGGMGTAIRPLGSPSPQPAAPVRAAGPLGTVPTPPVAPDMTANMAAQNIARQNEASVAPNAFASQLLQQQAQGAGLQAEANALPTLDPTDRRFNPAPYQPTALPSHQFAELPTRPAPGHDPASQGLAALASIFDPKGAGAYSAQPIMAGVQVANQQYEDRQRSFQQHTAQLDQQYQDALSQAQQGNQAALFNLQGQQRGAEMSGSANDAMGIRRAGIIGGEAQAQAMIPGLTDLSGRATKAAGYGADLQQSQAEAALAEKQHQDAIKLFQDQFGPQAKYFDVLEQQAGLTGRNALTNSTRQTVAETGAAARTGAAQIGADAKIKVGAGNNATSAANNIRNNADDGSAPTGPAAKDPRVQNAYRSALQLQGEVGKTERLLLHAWQSTPGVDTKNNAAFAQWMHANPVWQQASTANTQAWSAYQNELARVGKTQTPTPGGASQGSGNATGTAPGRTSTGGRTVAPPAGSTIIRYDRNGNRVP